MRKTIYICIDGVKINLADIKEVDEWEGGLIIDIGDILMFAIDDVLKGQLLYQIRSSTKRSRLKEVFGS